jgi:hypothetical protein
MKVNPEPFEPIHRDKRKKYANPMVYREGPYKYWLMYKGNRKAKTGPFTSATKAKAWYNNGGR